MGDCCRCDAGGHAWEDENVISCHPLSVSLREGAVRAGMADGIEIASSHDHRYMGVVLFCSIPLIPEKDRYAGSHAGDGGASKAQHVH